MRQSHAVGKDSHAVLNRDASDFLRNSHWHLCCYFPFRAYEFGLRDRKSQFELPNALNRKAYATTIMKNEIEKLNTSTVVNRKSQIDNAIALTPSSSLRGPQCSPWLNLLPFRGYSRLTAPIRGKTRLIAPNRAKIFSGGFRACNRGCTLRPASNCHNLHQLAHTCAKRYFCAKRNSSYSLGALRGSVVRTGVTPTNGKSRLLTPFKKFSRKPLHHNHDPTHNPNLTLCVLRASVVNVHNPNLTLCIPPRLRVNKFGSSRNSGEAIPTSCPSVPPPHRF